MITRTIAGYFALLALSGCGPSPQPAANATPVAQQPAPTMDRTVLPIREPARQIIKELDARNVKAPPRFEVKAPKGAPNIIVFLIDDMGFGHPSAFGGGIPMPAMEKVANNGLRFNRFHTTALCAPTRMALMTGRNHHSANTGSIMEVATSIPGQHRHPAAEHDADRRDPAAERLQHGGLWQVSRNALVGSQRVRARSTAGRRVRDSTSGTASLARRRISGHRSSTTEWSRSRSRRRRTITSRPT